MKKFLIAATLSVVATSSMATQACSGTAGAGVTVPNGTAGTDFILQSFIPRCSANVFLDWEQNARAVGVGASSSKGGMAYSGNSEGGAVAGTPCGTNKRCDGTESGAKATAALNAASS